MRITQELWEAVITFWGRGNYFLECGNYFLLVR
jgi:hypothetical protein